MTFCTILYARGKISDFWSMQLVQILFIKMMLVVYTF